MTLSSTPRTMEQERGRIRIELTEEQTDLIKQVSGKSISALEFSAQEWKNASCRPA